MAHVLDTSILLINPDIIDEYDDVIIPSTVVEELDRIKTEDSARGKQAREVFRKLVDNDSVEYDIGWYSSGDEHILNIASRSNYTVVTADLALSIRCKFANNYGSNVILVNQTEKKRDDYSGLLEFDIGHMADQQHEMLAEIESNPKRNVFDLKQNQYLLFTENGAYVSAYKWTGETNKRVKYTNVKNSLETVKPKNPHQQLLFDMLQDDSTTIKATFGPFGSGKDYVMLSHAVMMLEKGKIDRIVWVRNNVEVKDSNPIGFLPADINSKLLPFAMPLADHLGGVEGLNRYLGIDDGVPKIEIQHLGFIRGRDIKNSLIYVSECANNTKEHIQLLLGRVGEGSQIWFNGDTRQVDGDKFRANSGVDALKRLAGDELYGQVTLYKTERSKTAAKADLLD